MITRAKAAGCQKIRLYIKNICNASMLSTDNRAPQRIRPSLKQLSQSCELVLVHFRLLNPQTSFRFEVHFENAMCFLFSLVL